MSEKRYSTRAKRLIDSLVRLHSNTHLDARFDTYKEFSVPWDVNCVIPDPPPEEEGRRRSRRLSGEGVEDDSDAPARGPRRVFVADDDDDGGDDDDDDTVFGDPDGDLESSDSEDD